MRLFQIAVTILTFLSADYAMAQEHVRISSDWGNVTAQLNDNAATRSLLQMLPITIDMRDHMRQEKTGNLPSPLDCPPAGLCGGNPRTMGPGSFRYLLSKWSCPQSWNRDSR
jgi:hypothetical protein